MEIEERDRNITAIPFHYGLYMLTQMSFVLKNAPATIQTEKDVIFAPEWYQFALVYTDGIVVFYKWPVDHINRFWAYRAYFTKQNSYSRS